MGLTAPGIETNRVTKEELLLLQIVERLRPISNRNPSHQDVRRIRISLAHLCVARGDVIDFASDRVRDTSRNLILKREQV